MSEPFVKQNELFRSIARASDNFKKSRSKYSAAKIRSRITSLKKTWAQCIDGHAALYSSIPDKDKPSFAYFQTNQLELYKEQYQSALDLMCEDLEALEPVVRPNRSGVCEHSMIQSDQSSALSLRHLPPITLPPFSGDFHEWESFRDLFKALIMENKELSDFSKMHFLASSLTGSARDVISSISITASNFPVAWQALLDRFENKRKLIEIHISALYNLPAMAKESAVELHTLRDNAGKSIAALKSLERSDPEILSDILLYFITQKLDASTRRSWKLKCSVEVTPPSYNDLIKFVSARALALEELTPTTLRPRSVRMNNATVSGSPDITCPTCKQAHFLFRCSAFLNKSPNQRRDLAQQYNVCFNCLSSTHTVDNCRSQHSCRTCNQRHHSLLHLSSVSSSNTNASVRAPNSANINIAVTNENANESTHAVAMSSVTSASNPAPVLLATAKILIESPTGRKQAVRALLDQGSEVTFIAENLAQGLRLSRVRTHTQISSVGGSNVSTCRSTAQIHIYPRDKPYPRFSTQAFILPMLTKYCPRVSQCITDWKHLKNLSLADDEPTGSAPIEIIIGADLYSRVILHGVRKGLYGQPIAQNSHFGWLISGPISSRATCASTINVLHCALERDLQRFWELEEVPTRKVLSLDDEICEQHFLASHSRTSDGRYIVRLPFKRGPPIDIGESRTIALKRLTAMTRRINADPSFGNEYNDFLREYERLSHMSPVSILPPDYDQTVYIPHHAVIRETSATTRLRVVFNASSNTSNGTSLNSHMLAGPKLQLDLPAVLLRWRRHAYVQDYQLCTVTYGTASAPFLALRVIQQLNHDKGDKFPLASPILRDHIYVDDVLFGADSPSLLRCMREQLCALLALGKFKLRKWASNKSELLGDISPDDHGLAGTQSMQFDDNLSILGLSWSPVSDSFQFQVSLHETIPSTKRAILSAVARLFDPLGWATPLTITAKIFIQNLWKLKLDWDSAVSLPEVTQWQTIYKNLIYLNGSRVPRWTGQKTKLSQCELHGFADASSVAYAAAIYIRVMSESGHITTQLLIAKSKVAPIKPMSIPRLELSAMLLLARLMKFTQETLQIYSAKNYGWTDSTVALAWVQSHPSRWTTFVANRIVEIQSLVPNTEWRHVSTHDNPADCASRGLLGPSLKNLSLWWHGPPWLALPQDAWYSRAMPIVSDSSEESRPIKVYFTQPISSWELETRFSSWPKLLKVTAYILRFVHRLRTRNRAPDPSHPNAFALSNDEYQAAALFWLHTVQKKCFPQEIDRLSRGQAMPPSSKLTFLHPFLDEQKFIRRTGGRIHRAPLSRDQRHPILLDNHPIVDLIIRYTHVKNCHSGLQLTLSTLRQQFWIIKARTRAKQIIHQCVTCVRERAATPTQLMGQLPVVRVSAPSRSFEHCGLDYAGPIALRTAPGRGHKSYKGYIALFICLASRAVHLELVSNYTTPAFLAAFTRFCSRRGLPIAMYSDNGTTFVGADKELAQAYRATLTDPDFLNKTIEDHITWHFISPHAPHFGGLWEAGVRSVKHHLRRVLGTHTLTYEEMNTLLCRIEACLNSRPIGPLRDDISDYAPLTPGHFLIGAPLNLNPEPSTFSLSENHLSRWQLVRQMTERFWRLWQSDYVNTLQQRQKWKTATPNVKIGSFVLLKNPLLPPAKWEFGRIIDTHPGPDGLLRVVTVRTAQSEYKRPVVKLCVLPIESSPPEDSPTDNN